MPPDHRPADHADDAEKNLTTGSERESAQPRWGWDGSGTWTQGSAFCATLGFVTESRWDSGVALALRARFSGKSQRDFAPQPRVAEPARPVAAANLPICCSVFPWVHVPHDHQPQRGCVSIPQIPFVPFDLMLAKKLAQFLLEAPVPVVFLLPRDVIRNPRNVRLAHREHRVTRLPFEISKRRAVRLQPLVGHTFDFLDPFRLGHRSTEKGQQVHVILDPTGDNRRTIEPSRNLRQIPVQFVTELRVPQQWTAILHRKDEVKVPDGQRSRHKTSFELRRNPDGVVHCGGPCPRVAPTGSGQPWALSRNPVGILEGLGPQMTQITRMESQRDSALQSRVTESARPTLGNDPVRPSTPTGLRFLISIHK